VICNIYIFSGVSNLCFGHFCHCIDSAITIVSDWPALKVSLLLQNKLFLHYIVYMEMSNQETQVSSLPMPPERYIANYTEENIRRNRAPRPPPPPSQHEVYSMFGIQYNNDEMIRSLESQNIKRLIPIHFDRRKELKKLNHSLLVNFLDLIDFLILNPDSPRRTEKVRVRPMRRKRESYHINNI